MDVEQGVVVYVAAESPESVQRRVWAWKRHHGVEHLPLVVITASVDLLNGSTDKVLACSTSIRERHGRVALVVVDTLARAMTGNENSPDDMGKFVAACGRIREACEGHVLVVHHYRQGPGQRRPRPQQPARRHGRRAGGDERPGRRLRPRSPSTATRPAAAATASGSRRSSWA